jgi:UDP-N-acetylglucosamine--N-acetylmuramyl-(pentapeptide) pyrophosphoryl-undecaprenol N-acetylglucosamine transferase
MTALLVASTGGHLAELYDLVPRLGVPDRRWVTFDSPQSRSLLEGEDVVHVRPSDTRDLPGALRTMAVARRMLSSGRYDEVFSTGASIALSFFVPAVATGVRCTYIESATRTDGPSLTGRLAARLPRTRLFTQHPAWADHTWRYGGSIFDSFLAEPAPPRPVRKVVVTLGTHPRYAFPRLLNRLVDVLPPGLDVLWQVGGTRIARMPAGARAQVPIAEMRRALCDADVVISHAGVGSALAAMQAGRRALYVPRRRAYGEHVDDHQVAMARDLEKRDLVVAREAGQLTFADLETAARWSVRSRPGVTPFRLTSESEQSVP